MDQTAPSSDAPPGAPPTPWPAGGADAQAHPQAHAHAHADPSHAEAHASRQARTIEVQDQAQVQADGAEASIAQQAPAGLKSSESGPSARPVKVYKPPNSLAPMTLPSPPTEEPKATPAELKAAFADHIQMRHGPDAPLMTKAMREKAEAMLGKQKRTWEYVKIRVRFSDRTQIESSFPSSASINEVYTFVRGAVRQDVLDNKKGGFTLYTAPPCKDYVESDAKIRGKGLVELGLAPAAVLNVRWEDTAMNSNAYPAPLKAELLCSAADLPPPKPFDRPLGHSSDAAGGSGSAANSGKATGQRDPKALPKWLKGFSKK